MATGQVFFSSSKTRAQGVSQKQGPGPGDWASTQVFTTMINAYAESGDVDSALVGRLLWVCFGLVHFDSCILSQSRTTGNFGSVVWISNNCRCNVIPKPPDRFSWRDQGTVQKSKGAWSSSCTLVQTFMSRSPNVPGIAILGVSLCGFVFEAAKTSLCQVYKISHLLHKLFTFFIFHAVHSAFITREPNIRLNIWSYNAGIWACDQQRPFRLRDLSLRICLRTRVQKVSEANSPKNPWSLDIQTTCLQIFTDKCTDVSLEFKNV